jgi:hypothetical protein
LAAIKRRPLRMKRWRWRKARVTRTRMVNWEVQPY